MVKGNKSRQKPRGFTLVELMIATSIFSLVLLVGLNGFFQIGKIYYKGVITTQTQATAQKVMDDMTFGLQFAANAIVPPTPAGGANQGYMCIGGTRYTYFLYHQVDLTQENPTDPTKNAFGLLRDSGGCGDPFAPSAQLLNPNEMLGSKMRLSELCLLPVQGNSNYPDTTNCLPPASSCSGGTPGSPCLNNLYLALVKVAFGDDNIFSGTSYSTSSPTCNQTLTNSQYCSVANLQAVVNRGYGN